jgi:hypothetical protein
MNVGFIDCNMRKQYHQIHTYTEKYKLKYFADCYDITEILFEMTLNHPNLSDMVVNTTNDINGKKN